MTDQPDPLPGADARHDQVVATDDPGSPLDPAHSTRGELAVVAGIVLLAALLRVPFLSKFGLWLDEVYVREAALEPISANLRTVHFVHFLAVKAGLAVSDSDFGLRLASALLGVAAPPLAWLAVRGTLHAGAAVGFALALAVVPYFINYSIDANYYSHVIFWCLCGLAVVLHLLGGGHPAWLFLLAPLGLTAFFVHPFSAIYFASLIAVGGCGAWREWRTRRMREESPGGARFDIVVLLVGLALAVAAGGLLGRTASGRELMRVAGRFADMIELGHSPTNVEFSTGFFVNFFRRIGPAYWAPEGAGDLAGWLATAGTLICFVAFVTGLIRLRSRLTLVALILLPFILSFAVLFNLRAERHFNLRYFSYLVPLYWLGIAVGLQGACIGLARILPRRTAYALPIGLMLLAMGPQYAHLMLTDGRNWDAVIPSIAARARPGEPIVFTNWAEETMLPLYARRYGLDDQPLHRLAHTPRRDKLSQAELKDLCYRSRSLWFVSSWLDIQSTAAVEWAASRMKKVAHGASIFSDRYDVTAYHWDFGGSYVLPPRILDYRPTPEEVGNDRFEHDFLFEERLTYRIETELDGSGAEGPILRTGEVALRMAPAPAESPAAGKWSVETTLGPGVARLGIEGPGVARLRRLRIAPVYPGGTIPVSAVEASDFYPSDFVWAEEADGQDWLVLKRNTFATWDFGLLEGGLYELGCVARHDRPAPVWIEIRVNGEAAGVLEFSDGTAASGVRYLPLRLPGGSHRLTARFLNEGPVEELPEDLDRDAWIQAISLRPVTEGEIPRDDRFFAPGTPAILVPIAGEDRREGSPIWTLTSGGVSDARLVPADLPEGVAWRAELPRESRGLLLRSAPIPLPSPGWSYVSAQLRAQNLLNHSINLRIAYLNADGEPEGEKVVNQEGIYRTTGWVRFVDFQPLPDTVRFIQIAFWAYPNGRQPSPEAGGVEIGDVRLETGGVRRRTEAGAQVDGGGI